MLENFNGNATTEKDFISEIENYKKQLLQRTEMQDLMKNCNVIIRKSKGKNCTPELITQGLSEAVAFKIQNADYMGRIGFRTFELTNNNANIRRIEGRILELEKKEELSSNEGEKEFLFDGFKVVYNYSADRIQVMHDEKPTRELMNELKHQGFKFSFNNTAWQRHLNNGGIYAAMNVLKIDLPRID